MRFTIAFVHCCITNTQSKGAGVRTGPEGAADTLSFSVSVNEHVSFLLVYEYVL